MQFWGTTVESAGNKKVFFKIHLIFLKLFFDFSSSHTCQKFPIIIMIVKFHCKDTKKNRDCAVL